MLNKLKRKFLLSDENSRAVMLNILGAFVVKGAALIVTLLTTPAYIRYFDDNNALGLWYTLLSVIIWILNFDFGIGNGLRNKLATSLAQKDDVASKRYISSAYISVGVVVLVTIIASLISFDLINWNKVFNISTSIVSAQAIKLSVKIIFIGIMVQFLLRLVSSILYAMQLSSLNNFLTLLTTIINLVYISIADSRGNDKNLIAMSIVHIFAVNIPLLVTTVLIFSKKLKNMRPKISEFNIKYATQVLGLGGMFFLVQIFYMIIVNTNEYLITYMTESANVVEYQVYYKLTTLIGTLITLAFAPVWSAVTKAFAENKYEWIKKLYKRLLIIGALTCVFEFIMIPFLQVIMNIWLGESSIIVDYRIGFVFAILGSLMVLSGILSVFANGTCKLKPQIICFGIGALLKVPLSLVLVKSLDSWIGIIIFVEIALAGYVIVQAASLHKLFKNIK